MAGDCSLVGSLRNVLSLAISVAGFAWEAVFFAAVLVWYFSNYFFEHIRHSAGTDDLQNFPLAA